jgi:hypothetical protein
MTIEAKPMKYVQHDDVPEIFADSIATMNFANGMWYVELARTRLKDPGPPAVSEQHTTGRLIVGPVVPQQLEQAFSHIKQHAPQGTVTMPPSQSPPSPAKPN